jgi:hypothetical protein
LRKCITQEKNEMKVGDLVLYDRFGSAWDSVSPATIPDDFGTGIILQVIKDPTGREDDSCAIVMKDDGTSGRFSMSYLVSCQ